MPKNFAHDEQKFATELDDCLKIICPAFGIAGCAGPSQEWAREALEHIFNFSLEPDPPPDRAAAMNPGRSRPRMLRSHHRKGNPKGTQGQSRQPNARNGRAGKTSESTIAELANEISQVIRDQKRYKTHHNAPAKSTQ